MGSLSLVEAAETWAQRAQAELGAEARFEDLLVKMTALGTSEGILNKVRQAIADEKRHAKLCAEMATTMGHETGFSMPPMKASTPTEAPAETPMWPQATQRQKWVCDIVLMCCITETINASLMHRIFSASADTPQKKLVQEILKDEVKHSQIGWAFLSEWSQRPDGGSPTEPLNSCSFLGEHLKAMLDMAVKDELFAPSETRSENIDDPKAFDVGVLPIDQRLSQFKASLLEIVIPGFKHFKIPTDQAESWLHGKSVSAL